MGSGDETRPTATGVGRDGNGGGSGRGGRVERERRPRDGEKETGLAMHDIPLVALSTHVPRHLGSSPWRQEDLERAQDPWDDFFPLRRGRGPGPWKRGPPGEGQGGGEGV